MEEEMKMCQDEINDVLERYQMKYHFNLMFPKYNPQMLPDEIKLAVNIVVKEGLTVVPVLVANQKKEDPK